MMTASAAAYRATVVLSRSTPPSCATGSKRLQPLEIRLNFCFVFVFCNILKYTCHLTSLFGNA